MKILVLDLKAYGPFTATRLDLGGGDPGMQVIYGPNEAGKSSALRALKAALYGIPAQTPDNFLHHYGDLRIGVTLRLENGTSLGFVRRKGNVRTVLSPEGQPLETSVLTPFLPVDEVLFDILYGIDHATLSRGGEELLEEHGEIGRAIFSAGMGGANLRRVSDEIDAESERLFKPRASNPQINRLSAEYNELLREQKNASLPPAEWRRKEDALDGAGRELREVEARLADSRARLNRLERVARVLPRLARLADLRERIGALGEVTPLPEGFGDQTRDAQRRLAMEAAGLDAAKATLKATRESLARIPERRPILDQADVVFRLIQRVSGYRDSAEELPRLQGEQGRREREAAASLEILRPGLDPERVDSLRIPYAARARIETLAGQHDGLESGLVHAGDLAAETRRRFDEAHALLDSLSDPRDPEGLVRAVEAAARRGDLGEAIRQALAGERSLADRCEAALSGLGLWSGEMEAMVSLPFPVPETMDDFEVRFSDLGDRRGRLDEARETAVHELADQRTVLDALQRSGALPGEADLRDARARREHGWELVRKAWLDGRDVGAEAAEFDPGTTLPEAYEHSVSAADALADRLRRESEAVHRQAETRAKIEGLSTDLVEMDRQREGLDTESRALESAWLAVWERLEITPRTPREMRAWLARQEKLREMAVQLRDARSKVAELRETQRMHRDAIRHELEVLGDTPGRESESLDALLGRARGLVDKEVRLREQRERLQATLRDLETERKAREASERQAREALSEWRRAWLDAVATLGLDVAATPGEAREMLERLDALFAQFDELEKVRERISGIERDLDDFRIRVGGLVEQLAPELAQLAPDQAATRLHALLDDARAEDTQRRSLLDRLPVEENAVREAEAAIRKIGDELDVMRREARCETDQELDEAERKAGEFHRLTTMAESEKRSLLESGDGLNLEELAREAQGVDPDGLPGRIDALQLTIREELEPTLKELYRNKGVLQTELREMSGSDRAAELAASAQGTLTRLREETETFMRLRLASRILKDRIESYRQAHQGPVLVRAGELFARLTLGSYTGLRSDYDERDRPVIEGIAPAGNKRVGQMSSGTRDQLYLALRLATLERHLETSEPMPFIVDDILVHFDDERTRATLEVLAELGARTQVILFTHHRQVAGQAEALGEASGVFLHELRT